MTGEAEGKRARTGATAGHRERRAGTPTPRHRSVNGSEGGWGSEVRRGERRTLTNVGDTPITVRPSTFPSLERENAYIPTVRTVSVVAKFQRATGVIRRSCRAEGRSGFAAVGSTAGSCSSWPLAAPFHGPPPLRRALHFDDGGWGFVRFLRRATRSPTRPAGSPALATSPFGAPGSITVPPGVADPSTTSSCRR